MTRRGVVRLISLFTAALGCLGAWGLGMADQARTARRELRYQGEQAFAELCDAVSGMDAALQKSRYTITPGMTASLCAEIYSRAQTASASLGALPFPIQELEQTASFLSTTGDYAVYLLRRSGGGEDVTEQDRENLRQLADSAALLSENLRQLRADVADGLVNAADAAETGLPGLSDSFLQMEQEFPELPVLVYDGPFSSDVAERSPRMLQGAQEIDPDAAVLIATGFLGVRTNLGAEAGESAGKLPVWRISAGDYTVSVTRQGGYVAQAISSRTPDRTVLSLQDGLAAARGVLERRRLGPMAESYHILEGNALTVSYCAQEGDAICYPDMVKVTVAMDNGELLRYDAEGYLTCHGPRELPAAAFSAEDAAAKTPEELTLLEQRLAVIPSAGTKELFCRELVCQDEEGRHWLLYFNAVTGAQERILLLLEDESGTLAL